MKYFFIQGKGLKNCFFFQIRFLQSQAQHILRDIKTDQALHRAACNFKKVPGKTYYLYERESGQSYFSMLSPQVSTANSFIQNLNNNVIFS